MEATALKAANETTRAAWDANAAFWDERMGDAGNDFVNGLIWPAAQRLLAVQPGAQLLDIGCGNGLYARRLAGLGWRVVAFDFSSSMIEAARRYQTTGSDQIRYLVLDATDEAALLGLGEGQFAAAFSSMALMDIAQIEPLFRALTRLLQPGGCFVFATAHPCFNQADAIHLAEMEDRAGEIVTTYAVKVRSYLTPTIAAGAAIAGQPQAQLYFHRPLQTLLEAGFAAGFVVDALEERAFAPEQQPGRHLLGWSGKFSEIPPVLLVRMRLPK